MDEQLQESIRTARADGDPDAIRRAVTACERAGLGTPADLADRVVWLARDLESQETLGVSVEEPCGEVTWVGRTPGSLRLGEHRWWLVALRPPVDERVWTELERLEVPALQCSAPNADSPELVARAVGLPSLRSLTLTGGAADGALAAMGHCPRLTDLHVDSLRATAQGVASVSAPHLVRLSLSRTGTVKDLASLGDMSLRRLSLNRMRLTQKLIKSLPTLPELTHLDLTEGAVTSTILGLLSERVPGLRELRVTPKKGQKTPLMKALAGFERLEALVITAPRVLNAADLTPLLALRRLRSLDLHAADVEGLAALSELPALRRLGLTRYDDAALDSVRGFGQLTELALLFPEPGTTAEGLASVAQLPGLERLDLRADRFGSADELLAAVRAMRPASLRRLRFEEGWRNATEILPRLELPGVEVRQERLQLRGYSVEGSPTWVID